MVKARNNTENTADLFSDPKQKLNSSRRIYTVSEVNRDIKLILENTFADIWVEGEISDFKGISSAGHCFFLLKDSSAVLPAVIFGYPSKEMKFKIENGLKVICFGRISLYEKYGKYQLYIDKLEPKGIGSLQLALEQLKLKLDKEGLFSSEHKKPIPYLPSRIGIVTSLDGAAIKDIFKVLNSRFKDVHIIVSPVKVQGDDAKEEISNAIKDLNAFNERVPPVDRIDVMIVGRGGGSMEDLWAFNEEIVARAIYWSKIPIISAVGHERDWTVADLVADLRAATPSVAAELVVPRKEDLKKTINSLIEDNRRSFNQIITDFKSCLDDALYRFNLGVSNSLKFNLSRLEAIEKKLSLLNPALLIQQYKIKAIDFAKQINVRMSHFIKMRQSELGNCIEKLSSLSPLNILSRGYSITFAVGDGRLVKDSSFVKEGELIKTKLHKGILISKITEVEENG